MLVGSQLLAVASTLTGATRLQRSVMGASRAADGTGDYNLFAVLTYRFKVRTSAAVAVTATVDVSVNEALSLSPSPTLIISFLCLYVRLLYESEGLPRPILLD